MGFLRRCSRKRPAFGNDWEASGRTFTTTAPGHPLFSSWNRIYRSIQNQVSVENQKWLLCQQQKDRRDKVGKPRLTFYHLLLCSISEAPSCDVADVFVAVFLSFWCCYLVTAEPRRRSLLPECCHHSSRDSNFYLWTSQSFVHYLVILSIVFEKVGSNDRQPMLAFQTGEIPLLLCSLFLLVFFVVLANRNF